MRKYIFLGEKTMRIEEYWEDIVVYYVSFIVNNGKQNKIDRLIAFRVNEESSFFDVENYEEVVRERILKKFGRVEEILNVDLWDYGLLEKKEDFNNKSV